MFEPPPIDDDDIQWACRVLGLPDTAFSGDDGTDPRKDVLLCNDSLDIEACPGSGKTTLLVAKLAILARKWKSRRSGICVLSHTNAARSEIERCLGQTVEGTRLLSYPHFVGTIHGFVNEFLAMPWLRSLRYPITAIDDAYCEKHRRRLLSLDCYRALRTHVSHKEQNGLANYVGSWHIASPDFLVLKNTGAQVFANPDGVAARQLCSLVRQCAKDGFHRYEEMFMWAEDLLTKYPDIGLSIRRRFPLLFIDEVQDNSEPQSRLLHRVFIDGDNPVLRQRYGDSNQAIYGHAQAKGALSDLFPLDALRRDIPNSHRFGQEIADLANPLGLQPQNLQGLGPPVHTIQSITSDQHAVFLFSDDTVNRVLDTYAAHLLDLFSEAELCAGTFTAVGSVHRPGANDNVPRFVGHYWPEYDYELSYAEPRPNTFYQYAASGWASTNNCGGVHTVVERIAEATLRVYQMVNPAQKAGNRKRSHRFILERLAGEEELKARYLALILRFIDDEREIDTAEWQETWLPLIIQLAEVLGGIDIDFNRVRDFLTWPAEPADEERIRKVRRRDNCYRYPAEAPSVEIRVGSIHSVKGETHTATLVMETFYLKHHLSTLKPWLLGENTGQGNEQRVTMLSRLKQHYVAFTRPTHLLCVAMRDDLSGEEIQSLMDRSWRVGRLQNDGDVVWL